MTSTFISRRAQHTAQYTFACLFAASLLTVASAPLVQAQQPSTPQNGTQSNTTRAATKADLKKLEQNGYKPEAVDPHYPQDIQNAEKKANGTGNTTGQNPQ